MVPWLNRGFSLVSVRCHFLFDASSLFPVAPVGEHSPAALKALSKTLFFRVKSSSLQTFPLNITIIPPARPFAGRGERDKSSVGHPDVSATSNNCLFLRRAGPHMSLSCFWITHSVKLLLWSELQSFTAHLNGQTVLIAYLCNTSESSWAFNQVRRYEDVCRWAKQQWGRRSLMVQLTLD